MLGQIDPRDEELAKLLLGFSTKTKKGELVFIQCVGSDTLKLGAACAWEAARLGAAPYLQYTDPEIQRGLLLRGTEGVMKRLGRFELKQMKDTDVYIGIRGNDNAFELSDVPPERMKLYSRHVVGPVHMKQRVRHTRWVVLRYPNSSMSQLALTSRAAFADFYYKVCLVDYAKMARAAAPLRELMNRTDRVHIKGPGTDLRFSIKGIPAVPCCGEMNIPDGECFTAPVRTSIEGTVQFNAPSLRDGFPFENIFLRFEKGRVAEARAATPAQTKRLNGMLDEDAGARYVGEFALGFNPHIMQPMRDILFDEKVCGSFHMALGNAYDEADNGNKSTMHWDLVCIQRQDHGGGEIWFDKTLVRKDGKFVPKELKGLNPEAFSKR